MKKIVTLASRFSVGGAQICAHTLAAELSDRGFICESWFLMRAGELSHDNRVPIKIFESMTTSNPFKLIRMAVSLYKELKRCRPDVVVGFHPLANVLGALLCKVLDLSFFATQHNPSNSQGRILRVLELIFGSTSMYSGNIAVSSAVKGTYSNYPASYFNKLAVIHNGLPQLVSLGEKKTECRKLLSLPVGVSLIGMLGRLVPQKNPVFLVDLLPHLPNVHLAFAGEGELAKAILERASDLHVLDRVHLIGGVSGTDVTRFYRSLDLFLLPSLFEGFGRTIVEAMQEGVPIIANDLEVTREVIAGAGLLRDLSVSGWCEAILEILHDQNVRDGLSENARSRSKSFSLDAMVSEYVSYFEARVVRNT